MSSEPTDELTDNIVGDITDAMMSGIFSSIIMKMMFGKNVSMKSLMNMETLKDGAKMGGSIALYRRLGRPAVNKMMGSSGMDKMIKL